MQKIPTMFVRSHDRRSVIDAVAPGCEWVAAGEGVATRKWDGTCCLIRDGQMFKRREVKPGKPTPPDFELTEHDETTGKSFGWVPVTDGPEDALHREAFDPSLPDGTYELVGPRVNGNPDGFDHHTLVRHGEAIVDAPRTYDGLRAFLAEHPTYEGVVFWHPDGRKAKIKARDFARVPV